jgi:hypothetical protein
LKIQLPASASSFQTVLARSRVAAVFGCAGEWYLHHHPAGRKKVEREEHYKLESRFIAAVVIGVFMEFLALGHAIPAAMKLEASVASANERAGRRHNPTSASPAFAPRWPNGRWPMA